jgi:hypothetical protein
MTYKFLVFFVEGVRWKNADLLISVKKRCPDNTHSVSSVLGSLALQKLGKKKSHFSWLFHVLFFYVSDLSSFDGYLK